MVRGLTESLRSQNHEAANRLHTVVVAHRDGPRRGGGRLRHRGAPGRPAAHRPGGRRGRRPGARRAAAGQDRRGRRARDRARRSTGDARRRPTRRPARDLVTVARQPRRQRPRRRGRARRSAGSAVTLEPAPRLARASSWATAGPGWTADAGAARARARLVDQGAARRGGRGLGLALVGQVARRHGGEVQIGTSPLGGAEFRVALVVRGSREVRHDACGCWSSRTRRLAAEAHAAYVEPGRPASRSPGSPARRATPCATSTPTGTSTWCCSTCTCPTATGSACSSGCGPPGTCCDVIAVTSARDADVVRHAVAQGVVLYLLKPFTFADVPGQARAVRRLPRPAGGGRRTTWSRTRSTSCSARCAGRRRRAAEGMSAETLQQVTAGAARLRRRRCRRSEVAEAIGASRVTARRYLEHLADTGLVGRAPRYGGSGRPEVEYRWLLRLLPSILLAPTTRWRWLMSRRGALRDPGRRPRMGQGLLGLRLRLDLRGLRPGDPVDLLGHHDRSRLRRRHIGGLLQRPAPRAGPGAGRERLRLHVVVDDFDETERRILEAGGRVALPRRHSSGSRGRATTSAPSGSHIRDARARSRRRLRAGSPLGPTTSHAGQLLPDLRMPRARQRLAGRAPRRPCARVSVRQSLRRGSCRSVHEVTSLTTGTSVPSSRCRRSVAVGSSRLLALLADGDLRGPRAAGEGDGGQRGDPDRVAAAVVDPAGPSTECSWSRPGGPRRPRAAPRGRSPARAALARRRPAAGRRSWPTSPAGSSKR